VILIVLHAIKKKGLTKVEVASTIQDVAKEDELEN